MGVWASSSDDEPGTSRPAVIDSSAQPDPSDKKSTSRSTRTVTLTDVAQHAGVSPQTVSRSLRSPELVSDSTRERVRASIASTGYVPNLAARNLASNRSMTVAAIIPSISASVFADAVHGLDHELSSHGYQLFIGSTDYSADREEELVRALLGRRPDGMFIVGTEHTARANQLLTEARIPVVEAWSLTDSPIHSQVGFSNREAVRSLVQYGHAQGYRHPTFAGSLQPGDARAIERRRGFEASVRAIYPNETIRVLDSGNHGADMDAGVALLDRVLSEHPETDLIVFSSDIFAAGALLECARRQISVPGDIAVMGFGDFEIAAHTVPRLTTVAAPSHDIGTRAGRVLLESMHSALGSPQEIDLGFTIVARESA